MAPRGKEISIGELSRRTGLAHSAIRYYEDEGLVHPERTAAGQRRFLRSDIRRLSFVMIAQKLGFPLARIRELLQGLPDRRTPNARDWSRISTEIRSELDERIDTYSFGVMIYECLAGTPPFTGKVPGKLMMDIVMGNAPSLEEVAGVSANLSAVVMTAMSRTRERRFHTAQALARAFRDAA